MYSTRPKRGPIEAKITYTDTAPTSAGIPRVLSVAPLKRYHFSFLAKVRSVYSTRPKRGPIEAPSDLGDDRNL